MSATSLAELAALAVEGTRVARYVDGAALDPTLAPRPFLHPVVTLAGVVLTDQAPEDHRWHLGAGVAIQDVGGSNIWGGRTYLRDRGYTWREDHGRIEHRGWEQRSDTAFTELLAWLDRTGEPLLTERRSVATLPGPGRNTWRLRFATTLTNARAAPLSLGSPGSNGRTGGGYGGFFWRLPSDAGDLRVFTERGEGEEAVHGSVAPWLALTATTSEGAPWGLVLSPLDDVTAQDPWFVRVQGYPGVGSSLAWEDPVVLADQDSLHRGFEVHVVDGRLADPEEVTALLDRGREVGTAVGEE